MTPVSERRTGPDDRRDDDGFTIGQHSASITILLNGHDKIQSDLRDIRDDLASIRAILAEQKGERRVALWFVSAVSAVIAALLSTFGKTILGMH